MKEWDVLELFFEGLVCCWEKEGEISSIGLLSDRVVVLLVWNGGELLGITLLLVVGETSGGVRVLLLLLLLLLVIFPRRSTLMSREKF